MNKPRIYILAIVLTLIFGCSKKNDTTVESNGDKISYSINGTSWALRCFNLGTNNILSVPNGQQYTIIFSDSTATGLNDCNTYVITYSATSDGRISSQGYSSTKIYCGVHSYDSLYADGLRNVSRFEIINNSQLNLYYSNKTKILQFQQL